MFFMLYVLAYFATIKCIFYDVNFVKRFCESSELISFILSHD